MALQPGFERYEGLAFYGRDVNSDGHDAIVIVGQNTIEIRDTSDRVLTVWAPYSYTCNQHDIPLRCYFSGPEWIAPKETELAEFLDKYSAREEQISKAPEPSLNINKLIAICTLTVLMIGLIVYLIYLTSLNKLIDENIAMKMDNMIFKSSIEALHACNQEAEPLLREYLLEKTHGQKYVVVNGLNSAFASLPSGLIAIEETWLKSMKSEETLVALLNLAKVRNEVENPAKKLISHLSLSSRVNFLRTGELDFEDIRNAWKEFEVNVQLEASDLSLIEDPIGDFQDLADIGAINNGTIALPHNSSGLQLGERDWHALTNMCRTAS